MAGEQLTSKFGVFDGPLQVQKDQFLLVSKY